MVGEAIAGAVQGLGNVGIGIWNAYQQSKNYEYQKQLQKQIFEREDNALQRRVADAEKAGYNKFAVLGQGAGAGSVVSTTAPQIDENLGSRAADALQHTYQLAVERNSAKIAEANAAKAQAEKNITFNAEKVSNWQTALDIASMMKDAGFAVDPIRARVKGYKDGRPDDFEIEMPTPSGDLFSPIKYDDDGWNFKVSAKKDSWLERAYNNRMLDLYANAEQNQITGDLAQVSGVIKILQGLFGTVRDASSAYRSFRGSGKKK